MSEEVILRFDHVTFEYEHKKPLLDEASFSVHKSSKITLMGQNGAGKSTLFNLIKGNIKPKSGKVSITNNATIGSALQVLARADFSLTIEEYFAKNFEVVPPGLKNEIHKILGVVNLSIPIDRIVGELSGGQQARLLLAVALIQNPDILLLDEPTNNLDQDSVTSIIKLIGEYSKNHIVFIITHIDLKLDFKSATYYLKEGVIQELNK